jgi:hypothetical protein
LRVEFDHLDLIAKVVPTGPKNISQHPRVEKEGGAKVETKACPTVEQTRAAAWCAKSLEHSNPQPGASQKHCRGQTTRASADDRDGSCHPACLYWESRAAAY